MKILSLAIVLFGLFLQNAMGAGKPVPFARMTLKEAHGLFTHYDKAELFLDSMTTPEKIEIILGNHGNREMRIIRLTIDVTRIDDYCEYKIYEAYTKLDTGEEYFFILKDYTTSVCKIIYEYGWEGFLTYRRPGGYPDSTVILFGHPFIRYIYPFVKPEINNK